MSKVAIHAFDSLTKAEREQLLVQKQQQFVKRQLLEVHEEMQCLGARCIELRGKNEPRSRETFSLSQFLPANGDGSPLLHESIRFYETHDGCPFHATGECDYNPDCCGIWVRMGNPCWHLVDRVKKITRALVTRS